MENTSWHSTKMEPLRLYLSTCNKAGFKDAQLQHVLLFQHLNLEGRGAVWVHRFPDMLRQNSDKHFLSAPDGTELLKHWGGTAALPNPILCPAKTKVGFSGDQMSIVAVQQCLGCLRRDEMVFSSTLHSWGVAKGWRLKTTNGDFPV